MKRKLYRDKKGKFLSKKEFLRRQRISKALKKRSFKRVPTSKPDRRRVTVAGKSFMLKRDESVFQPEPGLVGVTKRLSGGVDLVKAGSTRNALRRSVFASKIKEVRKWRKKEKEKFIRIDFVDLVPRRGSALEFEKIPKLGRIQFKILPRHLKNIETLFITTRSKVSSEIMDKGLSISLFYRNELYKGKVGISHMKSVKVSIEVVSFVRVKKKRRRKK